MNSKIFGGILLIVGTTVGAGMLALPVVTAELGFLGSLILLFSGWAVMTSCAFLFLEVNLWLPKNSNLISMAGATLGKFGQMIAWIFYLLLLYSILCAYIAGGGDLFHYVLNLMGLNISIASASILFTLLFGVVVYLGIRSVDYVNRGLMLFKLGAFIFLILVIFPSVSSQYLMHNHMQHFFSPSVLTVTTVAFGNLLIIPSLRTYFDKDIASLRKAIFFGSLIPLFCYIAWVLVIHGIIPLEGLYSLKHIAQSPNANSELVHALTSLVQKNSVTILANFFTSICMATSFLSVSLSLFDFLADGLKVAKQGLGNLFIFCATFMPPILIVLYYPNAFIRGLNYAGICCFVLMILLPPVMAWRGRYHHHLAIESYQVRGGKWLLACLVLFATLMIGFGVEGVV